MPAFLKSIFKRIVDFFKKMEKKKLILIGIIAAVVIISGVVGAILLNRVDYTVLYSGLDADESGTIMTVLKNQGVQAKVRGTDTILVPAKDADELRIELASKGYPQTGLNYDLFSKSSSVGTTDMERQAYLQYQLQENMRTTIKHMNKVKDCIVIVNLATTSSYVVSSNNTEASAAVLLSLKDGETMTNAEAKTIAEFVRTCVPDLKLENINITDSKMNSYDITSNNGGQSSQSYSADRQTLTENMKAILAKQIDNVLEPAVGSGNMAVSVNLDLNFDKQTENKVEFSPPVEGESQGLLRSSSEKSSSQGAGSTAAGTTAQGTAGTSSNGIGASTYASTTGSGSSSNDNSTTYNYELNEIQTQLDKAQGDVENLSVSVLLNDKVQGISDKTDTIKSLVANAIGVKEKYITVGTMPFVSDAGSNMNNAIQQNQETVRQMSRNNLIKTIVIIAALAAVAVAAFILFKKKKMPVAAASSVQVAPDGTAVIGEALPEDSAEPLATTEEELQDLIVKKSGIEEKVDELMEKYPETAAQILRNWLSEDK